MLVIGVGNRLRGDDAAGPIVAERLAEMGIAAIERDGDGTRLLETMEGADEIVIVDAMRSGAAPGTIRRIDAVREPVPAGAFHYSSHAFGVAEAIETARAIGILPARLVLYGIEGARFDFGAPVDAAVAEAIAGVVSEIVGRD
ncbi:MAG TPA: hydrogenase maturation protease [Hyphomicrobiales bacterium]|nr:hydrogenase maturation protease [Hyphomicrobiales bacterium]